MALNAEEFMKSMKRATESFGASLTAVTQTFRDADYDAFYANEYRSDVEEANNELKSNMDDFDKQMEQWMKRFEGSPRTTNERKVRQAMKTSPPPPPAKSSLSEELDELHDMMQESRMNLGISPEAIYRPKSRNAFAPANQVGSIESELNSELMGLKKKYKNLEKEYNVLERENGMLRERNSQLRRSNETLGAKVAEYKQKLSLKKKKQDMVKPVKNIFDGIVKWFKE